MKKKTGLIIFICAIFIGLIAAVVIQNMNAREKSKKIIELQTQYNTESSRYRKLKVTRDSLMRINMYLAKYRTLTEAMTYRDSIRLPMKYKVGDVVRLKRDSARAVVSDIIVGGSGHEYYIKYKVLFKNNTTEEIIPELLY